MTNSEIVDTQPAIWILPIKSAASLSLAAGLIAVAILLATYPFFSLPNLPELGLSPTAEALRQHDDAQEAFRSRNYAVVFALIGLLMGVANGLATGRGKRTLSAIAGGLAGLLGGAIAGFLAGRAVAGILSSGENQSLVQSGIWHFVVWAAMAACIGFVIALTHDGLKLAVSGALIGLLAGIGVSLAWNLVASFAFSKSNLIYLLPEKGSERIVWACVSSIVLGIILSMGFKPAPTKSTEPPQPLKAEL